jgi:eukaryotic-like serine/threonine-protein kinase
MHMQLLNARYLLLDHLGRGGMGVVHKAADQLLGSRLVAIKEISQRSLSIRELAQIRGAFQREALLLASLAHQNLPRVYDHFSDHGNSYLVMDFIDGETLSAVLQRAEGGLHLEEVLLIAEQLCSVLDYLHTRQPPVIFRDLKPGNIMITSTGDHVYLIDFGIARLFKPAQQQDTLISGTPGYAPPEQYGGGTTVRSDIFSLGVVLHQLLTGFNPTRAPVPFSFPPAQRLNPQVPTRLGNLITQMVAITPERRPASIAVIKQELHQVKQEVQRASIVSSLITTGKVTLPGSPLPIMGKAGIPVPPAAPVGTRLVHFREHTDGIQTIAWSPDGKYLATGGRDKLVYVWNSSSGEKVLTYARHSTYVYDLAWSPDGKRLASTSFATVHVWDALTGENVVTYHGHSLWVYTVAWSPDGCFIATGDAKGEIHFWTDLSAQAVCVYPASSRPVKVIAWPHASGSTKIVAGCEDATAHCWDTITGNTPFIYKGHSREVTGIVWSPDDQWIVSSSRDKTVQIWDAQGRRVLNYLEHKKEVYTVAWSPTGKYIASVGEDNAVRIWEAATGNTKYVYNCHTNTGCRIAWSPDGSRIASVDGEKTIRVWQAP